MRTATRSTAKPSIPKPRNRKALIEAAHSCFEEYGIKKTTIGDICERAGLSRPIFYQFFENKQSLVLSITMDEIKRISAKGLRFRLREKFTDVDEMFTEAIYFGIDEALDSTVVSYQFNPENEHTMLRFAAESREVSNLLLKSWEPMLSLAEEQGRLRQDKTHLELAQWLGMMMSFIIIHNRVITFSPARTKTLISDFVLRAVLLPKEVDSS